jgi:hypothetical protein
LKVDQTDLSRADQPQLVVRAVHENIQVFNLDLRLVLGNPHRAVQQLWRLQYGGGRAHPWLFSRSVQPLADTPVLPSRAMRAISGAGAPEGAIVPIAERYRAAGEHVATVIETLRARGALVGTRHAVPRSELVLNDTAQETLDTMLSAGAVVSHEEFGESVLSLQPEGICWNLLCLVHSPKTILWTSSGKPVLQRSKVEILLGLHAQGWQLTTGEVENAYAPGGIQKYRGKAPKSYYAALLVASGIFAKGIQGILHKSVDHYYRCLILLPPDKLRDALARVDIRRNLDDWFRKCLGGHEEPDPDCVAGVPLEHESIVPAPDAGLVPVAPIIHPPELIGLDRCMVYCRDEERGRKIIFDRFSSAAHSNAQRGYLDCWIHPRCHRIRFVRNLSKKQFSANLIAWHRKAGQPGCSDKDSHMRTDPTVAEIAAAYDLIDREETY